MGEFAGRMQQGLKHTSTNFALLGLRAVSGAVLGFTIALIVQEILGQGEQITLAFAFAFSVTFGVFWRLSRGWGFPTLLVFDLVAVLTGLLLRLYVMVAPNA
jgi:hypothetical protein